MKKKKLYSAALVILISLLVSGSGCTLVDALLSQIDPGSILNLAQLGQVDFAGQRNLFIPSYPDWSKDPTCVIPGFCGGSLFYPFSSAPAVEPLIPGGP